MCHFGWGWLSNCTQNTRLGVSSLHRMWDAALPGTRHIPAGVVPNIPLMYKVDGRIFWKHLIDMYGSPCAIFAEADSQIAHKMLDLEYPLSTWNGMICYNERHSLMLACSISFFFCIKKIGGFFGAFARLSLFTLCHFSWGWHVKCTWNTWFGLSTLYRKWDTIQWGETAIAAEVVHNLS